METINNTLSLDAVKCMIDLQLIGAATGGDGLMSVRQLYNNIRRYSSFKDIDFEEFVSSLEEIKCEYDVRPGIIGTDVNYIALKKN